MTPVPTGWPDVLVIVGPTASGKSAVAVELARMIGAEVVNADAFQLYRGMDIGTAKVRPEQRQGVRHHLIDILDVTQEVSVAQYQRLGREVLRGLATAGVPAIVVGGSGLYVRALVDDLRFPGTDAALRARLEQELEALGPDALHARLSNTDPQAASAILPSNGRRIVRALEVAALTGRPFQASLPVSGPPLIPHVSVGIFDDLTALDSRIEVRVDQMLRDGLVAEVRSLLDAGLRQSPTARRALGYAQIIAALDGLITLDQARSETVTQTRRYARRQLRWFRRDPRTAWRQESTASAIADQVAGLPRTLAP